MDTETRFRECLERSERRLKMQIAITVATLPVVFYLWIEFVKLCAWCGQYTWP